MADAVWTQVGKETLAIAGDLLDPTLVSVDRLFQVISQQQTGAGNFRAEWRNNSISLADYAIRFQQNGGADTTAGNATQGILGNTTSNDETNLVWFSQINVVGTEKNYKSRVMEAGGANV